MKLKSNSTNLPTTIYCRIKNIQVRSWGEDIKKVNFIFVVPCIVILGWRNPKRCNCMQIFIYCLITLHVSGVHRAHHQAYIKLSLQPLVEIILSGEQASSNVTKLSGEQAPSNATNLVTFEKACSLDSMICTRGCNEFYVLLTKGAIYARNM